MHIATLNLHGVAGKPVRVADFVSSTLDGGNEYDGGRLEAVERTANNACQALGRLLDQMAERGKIDADSIAYIATGYWMENTAKFVPSDTKGVQ